MEASLVVVRDGEVVASSVLRPGQSFVLGRGEEATLRLDDPRISRRHLTLELREDGLWATDLGSRNGTFVGATRLTAKTAVRVPRGASVALGQHLVESELIGCDDQSKTVALAHRELDAPLLPADEFELLEELGAGAQGRVWVARQHLLGRKVAVKFLRREIAPGSEEHRRFLREAQLCCRVTSPHVVETYDVRIVEGRPYILMELVQGPTALDLLRRGPLPLPRALEIGRDVARALAAAAAVGVVHRDVKPANIFIAPGGVAKLGDFGIAKQLGDAAALTETGLGLGSLPYSAPEQIVDAKAVDARADLYALGATLYHLVVGQAPFSTGGTERLVELVHRIQTARPPRLRVVRPDAPAELETLVHQLLAKQPADRPAHAGDVAHALHEILARRFPQALRPRDEALDASTDEG